MQFAFCMHISIEALVKPRNICWVWSGMPGHVQALQKDRATISLERAKLFCLFVACCFTSMQTTVLLCHHSWISSSMLKVF